MIDFKEIEKIIEAAKRGELLDEAEAPNRPHPLKGNARGNNRILGVVLPNTEYEKKIKRNDGTTVSLLTPDTRMTQDVPRCCIVLQKSDSGKGWLRKFWDWAWGDPYKDIKPGSYLMFRENSGDYYEVFGVPYVNLDLKYMRFDYVPVGKIENTNGSMASEGVEKWGQRFVANKEADFVEMIQ